MQKGYTSVLYKNTLAYNLAYHIQKAEPGQDIQEIINKILTSFEYKEGQRE